MVGGLFNLKVLGLLLLLLIYTPVWYYLYNAWLVDPYYSHAIFIPLIAGALIFIKRDWIKPAISFDPGKWPRLLTLGLFIYLVGAVLDLRFIEETSFILSLAGYILYCYGKKVLRFIIFPVVFLIFMIPMPYSIPLLVSLPLQLFASWSAGVLVAATGIPVYQEGVNIYIPGFDFIVVKSCSGLNSTITLLTIGAVFAYLLPTQRWKKAFLLALTVPIALLSNIFRIWGVVTVGHLLGPEKGLNFFHTYSSPFLFGMAFFLLFLTAKVMGCLKKKES